MSGTTSERGDWPIVIMPTMDFMTTPPHPALSPDGGEGSK